MNLVSHNVFLSGLWGWDSFGTEQCRHFSPPFPNKCGGLKETVSYSFRYLDTWSPVGSAVLGTVQPAGGNTSQRVGFECYTALIHFHITLPALHLWLKSSLHFLFLLPRLHMLSCLLPWWSYLSGTLSQNRLLQVSSISIGVWSQQQKRNINQMTQRVQEDVWKYKFKHDVILCKSVNIWRRLYSRVRWESFSRISHCTYYTWYPDAVCLTVTLSGLKSFNYRSIVSSWNGASQTLVTKGTL